jgi:hypothetical protein
MLVHPGIKAQPAEFTPVKTYLETFYLRHGKIDPLKKKTFEIIGTKAYRLHNTQTVQTNNEMNWLDAETYTKMFYENIIAAVIDDNRESARVVLKAMQSSWDVHTYHIINCFEVALITYLLNHKTIKSTWDESKDIWNSVSSIRNVVSVPAWPENFVLPPECERDFEFSSNTIAFKRGMSPAQEDDLGCQVAPFE